MYSRIKKERDRKNAVRMSLTKPQTITLHLLPPSVKPLVEWRFRDIDTLGLRVRC